MPSTRSNLGRGPCHVVRSSGVDPCSESPSPSLCRSTAGLRLRLQIHLQPRPSHPPALVPSLLAPGPHMGCERACVAPPPRRCTSRSLGCHTPLNDPSQTGHQPYQFFRHSGRVAATPCYRSDRKHAAPPLLPATPWCRPHRSAGGCILGLLISPCCCGLRLHSCRTSSHPYGCWLASRVLSVSAACMLKSHDTLRHCVY
jgi:hypothetical protein